VATKLLDSFFLEGPKFLFWIAVGILKVNEDKLLSKGKDDDIFVAVLKDFFTRIGLADSDTVADPKQQDLSVMTGKPLYDLLMHTSCNVLGPLINNEVIESLRIQHRLKVVHQMEDTNRKSQIRTLCEQVSLSFDEIAIVYDQVRSLEFANDEVQENENSVAAKINKKNYIEEEERRVTAASLGGWGLVSKYVTQSKSSWTQKTISLADFQKVFKSVSPLKHESKSVQNKGGHPVDEFSLALVDRIYLYCAFQYHYIQTQKRIQDAGYIVDLAAMTHALDTIMKQPLHTRLRFLFDLHDIDGDTFLNKNELKQAMDSLLEMFQKSKDTDRAKAEQEEENYLKAVSSFLTAALQMGNSKAGDAAYSKAQSAANESDEFDLTSTVAKPLKAKQVSPEGVFRLSFNEFLLAILSQSVFVEYFERKWDVRK
jgi:hypothetical protein